MATRIETVFACPVGLITSEGRNQRGLEPGVLNRVRPGQEALRGVRSGSNILSLPPLASVGRSDGRILGSFELRMGSVLLQPKPIPGNPGSPSLSDGVRCARGCESGEQPNAAQ